MQVSKLSQKADKLKINYKSFNSVKSAFNNAVMDSSSDDVIVVTGSTYLFSEIKP